jgi:ubiquitin fusion degradation protein 1
MQCSNLLLLHLNFAVIMPLSALDRLGGLNIEYPMLFQIKHPSTERATHCGVLEFVADEGFIHMPSWVTTKIVLRTQSMARVIANSVAMNEEERT